MNTLKQYPLGTLFPQSPHSVCCSLPKMEDVIGYEEKHSQTMAKIRAGYPRFVQHFYLKQVIDSLRISLRKKNQSIYLVRSERTAKMMQHFVGAESADIQQVDDFVALSFPQNMDMDQRGRAFLQHTGTQISSRQAEDWLLRHDFIQHRHKEDLFEGDTDHNTEISTRFIQEKLASIYGAKRAQDISLFNSGMNAFYTAFNAVKAIQQTKGKSIWVQVGWLYLDTSEILKKFHFNAAEPILYYNVFDIDSLEKLFWQCCQKIAGIIIEVPTNPLLQTADIKRIYALAQEYDVIMVVDPTMATPCNVDVLSYADVVVNSLTKYAANQGDVMAGAIVLNASSSYYSSLKEKHLLSGDKLYYRDLRRLAFQIKDYTSIVKKINTNTMPLVAFLQKHPSVKKVYWAYEKQSCSFYDTIAYEKNSPGAVITISLHQRLKDFYDNCAILKSPSFGTFFTFMCPFMYLAHYDLVSNKEGREYLHSLQIDPELVRISVGTEPIEAIIKTFDRALSYNK